MSDDPQAAVSAYEALRSHVLAGAASPAGLVLLLRQGVAAWMARRLACPSPAPAVACATARATRLLVGEDISATLVQVLASMALCAQAELRV
jgi:hypothetical protein